MKYLLPVIFSLSALFADSIDGKEGAKNIATAQEKMKNMAMLQDWFLDKEVTENRLKKYPSFNKITKDFRPLGMNRYYLYSVKFNIELGIKNGACNMVYSGSRFLPE